MIATACFAILAQVAADGVDVQKAATTIQVGTGLVGISGLVVAIGILIKPYWDDRQKQRESLERIGARKMQMDLNNRIILEMHDWITEAYKKNPSILPEPPRWVKPHELGDMDADSRQSPSI